MALIQNEDNKCPTTKQVNDALKSMEGGGSDPSFNNTRFDLSR